MHDPIDALTQDLPSRQRTAASSLEAGYELVLQREIRLIAGCAKHGVRGVISRHYKMLI